MPNRSLTRTRITPELMTTLRAAPPPPPLPPPPWVTPPAPAEPRAEAPPQRDTEAPLQRRAEAPPQRHAEAPPQRHAEAPPQRRAEAPPQRHAEAPPQRRALSIREAFARALSPRLRHKRPWLVVALLVVLAALAGTASAEPEPDADAAGDEPAWDAEEPVTRGAPPATLNTSTPTASGLRFAMEPRVGLATKPVSIDAAHANGGAIVVFTTGTWKAAAGPEKLYRVFLERQAGARWVVVGGARRAKLGQPRVRNEWHVRDRASYRVTVMARDKSATGPLLRVDGEVRTVVYR